MGLSALFNIGSKTTNELNNYVLNETDIEQLKEVSIKIANKNYINGFSQIKQKVLTNISGCASNIIENVTIGKGTTLKQLAENKITQQLKLNSILKSTTDGNLNTVNSLLSTMISDTLMNTDTKENTVATASDTTETESANLFSLSLSVGICNKQENIVTNSTSNIFKESIKNIFRYDTDNILSILNSLQTLQDYTTNITNCSNNTIKNSTIGDESVIEQVANSKIDSAQEGIGNIESYIEGILKSLNDVKSENQTTTNVSFETKQESISTATSNTSAKTDTGGLVSVLIVCIAIVAGISAVGGVIAGIVRAKNGKVNDKDKKIENKKTDKDVTDKTDNN